MLVRICHAKGDCSSSPTQLAQIKIDDLRCDLAAVAAMREQVRLKILLSLNRSLPGLFCCVAQFVVVGLGEHSDLARQVRYCLRVNLGRALPCLKQNCFRWTWFSFGIDLVYHSVFLCGRFGFLLRNDLC